MPRYLSYSFISTEEINTFDNQTEHVAAYREFYKKLRETRLGKSGTSQSCPVCKTPVTWRVDNEGNVFVECGTSRGVSPAPKTT